jgi:hypothetical protein
MANPYILIGPKSILVQANMIIDPGLSWIIIRPIRVTGKLRAAVGKIHISFGFSKNSTKTSNTSEPNDAVDCFISVLKP